MCWRCNKPGHFRRDCRVNLGNQGRGRGAGSSRGNSNTAPVDWDEVRRELRKERETDITAEDMIAWDTGETINYDIYAKKPQPGNE